MPINKRDYYEVLGVGRSANDQELKTAYRRLAHQYHPDKNQSDPAAEEKFKEAAEAYAVLSNTEQRQRYDRFGHAGVSSSAASGAWGAPGFGGIEDILIDVVSRTRVHEQDFVRNVTVRQAPQPFQPLSPNHLNCPPHDRSGVVIEPLENLGIGTRPVVVANQGQPFVLHDFIDASLRISAVTDNVAKAERLVHRRAVSLDSFQRLPVGMDVGEKRDPQAGLS